MRNKLKSNNKNNQIACLDGFKKNLISLLGNKKY